MRRVEGILTRFTGGASIVNDHIAFRTFGARGFGIESIAPVIDELGYTARDTLTFPAKKLHAQWFAPPPATDHEATPLPRVFVSELKVPVGLSTSLLCMAHAQNACWRRQACRARLQAPAAHLGMPRIDAKTLSMKLIVLIASSAPTSGGVCTCAGA